MESIDRAKEWNRPSPPSYSKTNQRMPKSITLKQNKLSQQHIITKAKIMNKPKNTFFTGDRGSKSENHLSQSTRAPCLCRGDKPIRFVEACQGRGESRIFLFRLFKVSFVFMYFNDTSNKINYKYNLITPSISFIYHNLDIT